MAVDELPALKPYQAPRVGLTAEDPPVRFDWSGYLTTENAGHVAQRIREQFGDRWLVATSAHEFRGWQPEVYAPVKLENDVQCETDDKLAHVFFACGGYVYGITSWDVHRQPRMRLFAPEGTGNARDVLEWMHEAVVRESAPHLEFGQWHLIVHDRATNGQAYWLRFDVLEGLRSLHVVLAPDEAATAYEAMEAASALPYLDRRIDARFDLCQRIEDVFNDDDDGEKVKQWLPR